MQLTDTVMIEDDFLLGSTRKFFRSFCASNHYEFAEVYMDSTLEQCLEFDRSRGNKVSESVIREKYSKLEVSGLRLQPE